MSTTKTPAAPPSQPVGAAHEPLRMGDTVLVKAAPGTLLVNNETGGYLTDAPTPQTVTVTLLRRLQDGDLVLADQRA